MLANKNLARRVAITGLDKFDGMVLNAPIWGLLVADLHELLPYRKERALLRSSLCLGREKVNLFRAAQHARRLQAASVLAKPHSVCLQTQRWQVDLPLPRVHSLQSERPPSSMFYSRISGDLEWHYQAQLRALTFKCAEKASLPKDLLPFFFFF